MATETSTQRLSVMTTFHISNGAMPMEMDQLLFLNPLDVDRNQDSGTQLKLDGSTGPPTQHQFPWNSLKS